MLRANDPAVMPERAGARECGAAAHVRLVRPPERSMKDARVAVARFYDLDRERVWISTSDGGWRAAE
jgi:hypothetical protein